MKTRNGFISNSSSSSFVVAFDKVPESKEELRAMLFYPDQPAYPDPYDDKGHSIDKVLDAVWVDMQEPIKATEWDGFEGSGPMTPEQVRQEFEGGHIEGESLDWDKPYEEYRQERNKFGHEMADKFMAGNEGKVFFHFCYADDDSFGSAMEHGDLFHRLSHFRLSHH